MAAVNTFIDLGGNYTITAEQAQTLAETIGARLPLAAVATVYRGQPYFSQQTGEICMADTTGPAHDEPGFLSTSSDWEEANGYTDWSCLEPDEQGWLLTITVPAGARMLPVRNLPGVQPFDPTASEVIQQRGNRYRVLLSVTPGSGSYETGWSSVGTRFERPRGGLAARRRSGRTPQ